MRDKTPIPLNKEKMSALEELVATRKLIQVLSSRNDRCVTCAKPEFTEHLHFIVDEGISVDPVEGLPELHDVICAFCGKKEANCFKVCGKCFSATYCNKSCQKNHWSKHSKECGAKKVIDSASSLVNGEVNTVKEKSSALPTRASSQAAGDFLTNSKPYAISNEPKVEKSRPKSKADLEDIIDEVDEAMRKCNFEIKAAPKKISPVAPVPSAARPREIKRKELNSGETFPFALTFGSTPSNFYVQKIEDEEKAGFITQILNDECPKMNIWEKAKELKVGDFCAALFESDMSWYRAKVLQKTDEIVSIKFIDFGNIGNVAFKDIRPLPEQLYDTPALAIHCKLHDIKPVSGSTWEESEINAFAKLADSGNYTQCKVISITKDDMCSVDLLGTGNNSIAEKMLKNGHAMKINKDEVTPIKKASPKESPKVEKSVPKEAPSTSLNNNVKPPVTQSPKVETASTPEASKPLSSKPSSKSLLKLLSKNSESDNMKLAAFLDSVEENKSYSAVITTVYDKYQCKYCLMFNVDTFVEISNDLGNDASALKPCKDVKVGQIVAVKDVEDEWHRACILKINEDKTYACLFVDIGYVEKNTKTVYTLPQKYFEKASLFGLGTAIGESSRRAVENLQCDEPLSIVVVPTAIGNEVIARVRFEQGSNFCNMNIKSYKCALKEILNDLQKPLDPVETLPTAKLSLGEHDSMVVYQEPTKPEVFYVIGDSKLMAEIMTAIPNETRLGKMVTEPCVGMYCLAVCEGEEDWYRAVITKVQEHVCEVYFVDFGNYDTVAKKNLKTIRNEFSPEAKIAMAIKCMLAEEDQTPQNLERIEGAVNNEMIKMKVVSAEKNYYTVKLV
ncbi:hypothetical protein B4U79_17526 [Dinothrombium tinctorium]|uniref:Tudor domain-containing protein 1-like protein n=1 Tax=Dinothrombium tinctorium TaxID=1965070 RepID=A0A3S3Q080_9ACAR|nr:hypothetical protein B4U79_17526 [Dinothrombium tinctorium]